MSAAQNASDESVYDRIEALIARDLPRQGRIELVQVLEGVVALLSPAHSEFSDNAVRAFPMGCEPAAH